MFCDWAFDDVLKLDYLKNEKNFLSEIKSIFSLYDK